jgi:single-strand DNA-binding protein
MSINRVLITGNLTRDPELRATGSGMSVLQMGVAVNDRRKNPQSGEWEDVPNFIDVVMFGTRAESVSRFLSKGSKVAIEGKLRWSSWEDKATGAKRSKVEVVADDIEFMSTRGEGGGGGGGGYSAPAAPKASPEPVFEDDIPF